MAGQKQPIELVTTLVNQQKTKHVPRLLTKEVIYYT